MSESMVEIGRRVGERTFAWNEGCYYWGDAIAYDGLLALDEHVGAGWSERLAARLTRWHDVAPDSWDDALSPGVAAARLVERGLLDVAALERIVSAMVRLPRTEGVPLLRPQVPGWRTLVWVDSLYHLPTTLIAAGRTLDRPALVEDGLSVAAATLRVLACDGAVAHAYDTGLRASTGIRWTRGIGWALLGLLDATTLAQEAAPADLLDTAVTLLDALAAAQRENGHFPSVLGSADADDETSVAGFFVTAAHHSALPAERRTAHATAADRALTALTARIDDDGTVQGVSHDTHVTWSVSDYLHPAVLASPWGQGAALRALASAGGDPQ